MNRPRQRAAKKTGFTLVELLLYVAIATVLLGAVAWFMQATLEARIRGQVMLEVEGQGQAIARRVTQIVRNAASITTPATGVSGSSLTLTTYAGGTTPTVVDVSGTTLQITEGAGAPVALMNSRVSVSGFTVRNLSLPGTPGTLEIAYTLSSSSALPRQEYRYTRTFIVGASLRQP